jgi:hypothetical protein
MYHLGWLNRLIEMMAPDAILCVQDRDDDITVTTSPHEASRRTPTRPPITVKSLLTSGSSVSRSSRKKTENAIIHLTWILIGRSERPEQSS